MRQLLLCVALLLPQAAPRDPMRLLNVQVWHGEASVVIQGSKGTKTVDRRFTTKFRIEMPVGVRASLEGMATARKKAGAALPPQFVEAHDKLLAGVLWMPAFGKKEETFEVKVDDRWGESTLTAAPPPEIRMAKTQLKIDFKAGTYDLTIGTSDPIEMTSTSAGKTRKLTQRAVRGQAVVKGQPLPTDKDVLTGQIPIEPGSDVPGLDIQGGTVNSYVQWTLSPDELPALELDVDIPGYAAWLPEGKEDGIGVGNTLEIKAELRAKSGGTLTEKCVRIGFHLLEASREPGSAMNAPAKVDVDELDLRFDAALNAGMDISMEGRKALANNPGLRATAKLSCRDFGAFGELTVYAHTDLGRYVEGTMSLLPGETRIRLPKRDRTSKIADAWKKSPAADDVDADAQPPGPKTPGDGLTLYEEYRGFFVGGTHVRTDPDKRDLFVLTRTNHAKVMAGITMFKTASGLEVHVDTNEQLLKDRRVNYNSRTGFGGAQHGVVIMGFTPARTKQASAVRLAGAGAGTPKEFKHVEISSDAPTVPAPTAKWSGATVTGPDVLASTLAHELGHTVNVAHHGDVGDYDALWKVRTAASGSGYDVKEVVNGVETPITVIREDGKPYPWMKVEDLKVSIGAPGGVYSGVWDCLMRYDNANAYVLSTNASVRVDMHADEIVGTSFCAGKKGTGANDAARAPYDRFRDSINGNCLEQIRVKDW
jgi:hypothetical protein